MHSNSVHKTVQITATVTNKNDKVFVSVKDEGPGISRRNRIRYGTDSIKPMHQEEKINREQDLGLAITKEIIKAHGENIDLISTEGAEVSLCFLVAVLG